MKGCDWMAKKRIYEVAKELNIDNKTVVQKAKDLGFDVKNHMSSLENSQVRQLKDSFQNSAPAKKQERNINKNKGNKIKISVSSIRKNEKKNENRRSNGQKKRGNRNRRRNNDHVRRNNRNDRRQSAERPKTAARNLLKEFKQKQRAEVGTLDKEARIAKKEYHEE